MRASARSQLPAGGPTGSAAGDPIRTRPSPITSISVWGTQNAIVDNRPGATGGIATELTAAAVPDGYTLMLCQVASHAITPARAKKLPYDHVRDFAFVSMIGTTPNVIVTHPTITSRTVPGSR